MEAILACHPVRSTKWLDCHPKSCELWCIRTGPIGSVCRWKVSVELRTVKLSRRRHWLPVWSSLIERKRCADTEWLRGWPRVKAVSFPVTPTCPWALHRWSMVYHRLLFFEWSSFLAHRLVVIPHAIIKIRCKKEAMESWQQSTRKGQKEIVFSFSFSLIFPLLTCGSFFEDRSARYGCCWAGWQRTRASWCHQDIAWCWLVLRVRESWVSVQGCARRQSTLGVNESPDRKRYRCRW